LGITRSQFQIPISEIASYPWEEAMLHRKAKKNLNRQALLGFPTQFRSIISHPLRPIIVYRTVYASSNLSIKIASSSWSLDIQSQDFRTPKIMVK
jgi:hypothetical protein